MLILPFSTEFPLSSWTDTAPFVAQVVAWLSGNQHSNVLNDAAERDLHGETVYLRDSYGESLHIRQFIPDGNLAAIGFRHELPDGGDRLWRTEGVLRKTSNQTSNLLRIRTQCIPLSSTARVDAAKKPYLIKSIIADGLGGEDGLCMVTDKPIWLQETDLELARFIVKGTATTFLPVVYISAIADGEWVLSDASIEKLAYELGGVAHVVVEPNRSFSFQLRELSEGPNAYGGTIAIYLPVSGLARRYYLGLLLKEPADIYAAVRLGALQLRSQMSAQGWDWSELQEEALRLQRRRDRQRLSDQDYKKLYDEEIATLKERIAELDQSLTAVNLSHASESQSELEEQLNAIGPEIYAGEFWDRIVCAVKIALEARDRVGMDARTQAVLEKISAGFGLSPACSELQQELERSVKDPRRMAANLTRLLSKHGFKEKSDNKHIRLEPLPTYMGLKSITLPKTPRVRTH